MKTYILGLSCYSHDSSASLICDGEIVAAAQEERFTRIKQDKCFPRNAVAFCLRFAGISLGDVKKIFYYEDPEEKFKRIMSTAFTSGWSGAKSLFFDTPAWLLDKLYVKKKLSNELKEFSSTIPCIEYISHHRSHAASAFFPAPFEKALVLCIDGVGEWDTTTAWKGEGGRLTKIWETRFPHSLGLLYSAFTHYCGFKVDADEDKIMGLAPYGEPIFYDQIMYHLIHVADDGSFTMNMDYFDYATGEKMTSPQFDSLFGGPPRVPDSELTQREFNLAASVQAVLEEVVLRLARHWQAQTGCKTLCLAGGVALNSVVNGRLARAGIFERVWIQPASDDCGGSLGAALSGCYEVVGQKRVVNVNDSMKGCYLGPAYSRDEIRAFLLSQHCEFTEFSTHKLCSKVAEILSEGNVVGWFQGRMEFGPRSLGARSILGDARKPKMQSLINLKIKHRESLRPLAPAVLKQHAGEWFNAVKSSPYMLFAHPVCEQKRLARVDSPPFQSGIQKLCEVRSQIPAVTHVDCSARVQTVDGVYNPLFYQLLSAFHQQTGCPLLVNTSFNMYGEPIVESPHDAYRCFMRTAMDYLVLGSFLLSKRNQPQWRERVNSTDSSLD